MNRAQQFLASPPFILDLEKGMYDQAKRKVMAQRAVKQTAEAISEEVSSAEPKKPKFTMQHLQEKKQQMRAAGVQPMSTHKSELPGWFAKDMTAAPVQKKPKKFTSPKAPASEELSSEEARAVKRPNPIRAAARALMRSDVPEWFQKGEEADTVKDKPKGTGSASAKSKVAWAATKATLHDNTVAGHTAAMHAHSQAGSTYTRLKSRAQDRASQAYGAYVNAPKNAQGHAIKAKEHWAQVEHHRKKIEELKSVKSEAPAWFQKSESEKKKPKVGMRVIPHPHIEGASLAIAEHRGREYHLTIPAGVTPSHEELKDHFLERKGHPRKKWAPHYS